MKCVGGTRRRRVKLAHTPMSSQLASGDGSLRKICTDFCRCKKCGSYEEIPARTHTCAVKCYGKSRRGHPATREVSHYLILAKYACIMLDEAHERGVNTDVLLGILSRVVRLRQQRWDAAAALLSRACTHSPGPCRGSWPSAWSAAARGAPARGKRA